MIWLVALACSSEPPPPPREPWPDVAVEAPLTPGGARTKVTALNGKIRKVTRGTGDVPLVGDLVTPGFVDAHGHVEGLGKALASLDLTGAPTYTETLARVKAAPAGEGWLLGRGWDQNDWSDAPAGGWPLAGDLDALAPGRPIALTRVDGHAIWLSSAALAAAGITKDTPDPAGGRILRDAAGAPTGVLVDNAVELVTIPEPTDAEREARIVAAIDALKVVGITGVHDMGTSDAALAVLEKLDVSGRLPIRVWVYLDPASKAAEKLYAKGPWRGDHLAVVGVKAFADGALGSRGALLTAPYADEPDRTGLAVSSPEELRAITTKALGAGASVAIHGIGDQGVRNALDAFEAARAAHPDKKDVRLRVEHAQVVHPDDVARFAKLGVVASMQPTHATSDSPWAEARLGKERVAWAYAWRTLLDAQAPLALGSDFPVESPDPSAGLWAATTRGGWHTEEALTLEEAIAGFTSGAAWAVGEQAAYGEISVDRPADLTVWRRDGDRWRATLTIVDGRIVWP